MFYTLIRFKIKEFFRSPIWAKSLGLNLVLGFFIIYMLAILTITGIAIPDLLDEIAPGADKIMIFNSFILLYFITELVIRFFMQGLPVLSVQPFLHLPIKRSKLVKFMIGNSVLSFFNILPLFFAIPFFLRVVSPAIPGFAGWAWLFTIILFSLINNFILIYFKRQVANNPKIGFSLFIILVAVYTLNFTNIISLAELSVKLFASLLNNNLIILIPLILAGLAYFVNYRFLMNNMYIDEIRAKKPKDSVVAKEMRLLKNIGSIGEYIVLEIKLIWRNKRPRSSLLISPIFLLYGFLFYTQDTYSGSWGILIFCGVFMTAGFSLMHGQFFFAWESSYFDTLISKNVDFYSYFRAKFMFVVIISTVCYVLTMPYGLMKDIGTKILYINTASWLYNIGINSFVMLFFGIYNRKKIDMSKGAMMNYQGTSGKQFLIMIPLAVTPILIHLPFKLAGIPNAGLILIGAFGIIGLFLHKQILKFLVNHFEGVKHKMAQGFRQ